MGKNTLLHSDNSTFLKNDKTVKLYDLNSSASYLEKIKAHFSMAADLYKQDFIKNANNHYIEGYTLAQKHNLKDYMYHFRALKTNYDPDQLCCNDLENEYIEIVDYFLKIKNWKYVYEYSSYLATYYKDSEQYELACDYFEVILLANSQMKEL